MLSMYSNIAQNNWAEVLPFVQLAHNTYFSSTMHETPFFSMFGRQARLPIGIMFGIPHVGRSTTTEEFAHSTRENLQIAFELARRNLSERIDKKKANNSKLPPIPEFTPGQKVLVYKPHHSTDGPNPKLIQPWRGPYIICFKLTPVVYRIRHPDDTKQVFVHLAHIKSYKPHQSAPAPDFHRLDGLFIGKTLPTPTLEESETFSPHIGIHQVVDVIGHRRGRGRHSPHHYIYRLRLKGFGPEADLEYRAHQVPQCQELIAAYRAQHQLETITPPPCNNRKHPASKYGNPPGSDTAPKDGSSLESEPAICKRPCNKRKYRASKDGNPLGSDTPPEDGSPLESEPAIRKRPCNKQKYRASKDGNPLGSDIAPKDGSELERKPAICKRPCNKRKYRASKDGNPLGSDTPPEDGSPLGSEPAIRKRPCNKQKYHASKDGNPLGSDIAPKDGSELERKPAICKRPCNKREHRASKDGNPLGSDTPPEDGSPLESEPAIRKRPCNKQKYRASKDGNPLGSDIAPKDGSELERKPPTRKRKSRSGSNKEKNNSKRRK